MAPSKKRKADVVSKSIAKASSTNGRGPNKYSSLMAFAHTNLLTRLSRRVKTKHLTATNSGEGNKTTFFSLPGELRNEIYRLVLTERGVVHIRPRRRRHLYKDFCLDRHQVVPWREPGILRAAKMIRQEASAMYFKSNDFNISMNLADMDKATAWLQIIIRRCGNDPFQHLGFYMTKSFWEELENALPLAKLYVENELTLRPLPLPTLPSLFHMEDPLREVFPRALEEVIDLGKRAGEEGWSEDWLDVEFGTWLDEKLSEVVPRKAKVAKRGRRRRERARARELQHSSEL